MLRAASAAIASDAALVTSVARTQQSLERLHAELGDSRARHLMLVLDWSQPDVYVRRIAEHVAATAAPDLVVAWIHDDGVALRLLSAIDAHASPCLFFHVVGSSRRKPHEVAAELAGRVRELAAARYHQVILGSRRTGGSRRWLTDAEISAGVLEAIGRGDDVFLVGDPPD